jgi:Na+/H+ antiporter NhaD/arsenite permease-like protein
MTSHEPPLGELLPLWSALPFAGILLSIALCPLLVPRFWHRHYPKVAAAWALVLGLPFLAAYGERAVDAMLHIYLLDYVPFIILLWGLFTVAGGIAVRGAPRGTPAVNAFLLLVGTLIASWVGTTGASMLLIRPVLRANAHRKHRAHIVVFFIFLVANAGGSLTPLGDPPLFLGFLHGVPFFWTFRLAPHLGLVVAILLTTFVLIDRVMARREPAAAVPQEPLRVEGLLNLAWLGGIVGAVLLSGFWRPGGLELAGVRLEIQNVVRDAAIVAMGVASLRFTPRRLREANDFSWGPIREVAYLFAGIFMTIVPALLILKAGERGALGLLIGSVRDPAHYFWASGALSSFLDNAPTYLSFFNTQLGRFAPGMAEAQAVPQLVTHYPSFLEAVAAGSVFMGANTYIGNAPNFMVKSIAEEAGVAMPSFFGYLLRWALPILVPTFLVVTWVMF